MNGSGPPHFDEIAIPAHEKRNARPQALKIASSNKEETSTFRDELALVYRHTDGRRNIATKWMRPGPGIWKSGKSEVQQITIFFMIFDKPVAEEILQQNG